MEESLGHKAVCRLFVKRGSGHVKKFFLLQSWKPVIRKQFFLSLLFFSFWLNCDDFLLESLRHVGVQRVLKWHTNPWCSRTRGADFRVLINLRGCIFSWLLNRECAVEILCCCCCWTHGFAPVRIGSGNKAFLELGEQLVPVLEVQGTSSIYSPCVRSTAVHSLWCFLTVYKVLELTSSLRDTISGWMSPPSICCGPKLWG